MRSSSPRACSPTISLPVSLFSIRFERRPITFDWRACQPSSATHFEREEHVLRRARSHKIKFWLLFEHRFLPTSCARAFVAPLLASFMSPHANFFKENKEIKQSENTLRHFSPPPFFFSLVVPFVMSSQITFFTCGSSVVAQIYFTGRHVFCCVCLYSFRFL